MPFFNANIHIENENTHGYTLSTKQKAGKKRKPNAFFHLQNAHTLTHTQRWTSILVYFFLYCTLNTWETVAMLFSFISVLDMEKLHLVEIQICY